MQKKLQRKFEKKSNFSKKKEERRKLKKKEKEMHCKWLLLL